MKRNTILFMAAMVVAFVACNREEQPQAENTNTIKSFSVSMPVMSNGTETKTGLYDDSGVEKLVWKTGDRIYVARASEVAGLQGYSVAYETFSTDANNTQTATFTTTGSGIEADTKYIVAYTGPTTTGPNAGKILATSSANYIHVDVPSNQTYVEDGIAPLTMPMYAFGSELHNLAFHCLGNIVRLNLYSSIANVKVTRITLSSAIADNLEGGRWNAIAGDYAIWTTNLESLASYDTSFGLYNPYATTGTASGTVVLDCSSSDPLSSDSADPTAFNIVISRRSNGVYDGTENFSGGTSNITATIEWTKNGDVQTPKVVELTNLTRERRVLLGQIFNFGAKDIISIP